MVRVQRKIRSGHDLLAFFTMHQWNFLNDKCQQIWPTLNERDRETFYVNNCLPIDKEAYMDTGMFGARTYALKESPATLKYCRARLRV